MKEGGASAEQMNTGTGECLVLGRNWPVRCHTALWCWRVLVWLGATASQSDPAASTANTTNTADAVFSDRHGEDSAAEAYGDAAAGDEYGYDEQGMYADVTGEGDEGDGDWDEDWDDEDGVCGEEDMEDMEDDEDEEQDRNIILRSKEC